MKRLIIILILAVLTVFAYGQRDAVKLHDIGKIEMKRSSDTLIPTSFMSGTPTIYTVQNGGFVAGVNGYGDLAKAQAFEESGISLEGCSVWIGAKEKVGTWDDIALKVYALDGEGTNASGSTNNAPGSVLASKTLSVADLDTSGGFTDIMFDAPVEINQQFAVGLDFSGIDDTLGIVTTTDGDATTDLAWEQFSNGDWYTFQSSDSWGLAVDLGFFPVISGTVEEYTVSFTVTDGSAPLEGASISIAGTTLSTNSEGEASIELSEGDYDYTASKAGYQAVSNIITVEGEDVNENVILSPTASADTLIPNSFLSGTPTIYTTQNGGYVAGVNGYGDQAKAQAFTESGINMKGCLVWVGAKEKVGTWDDIALKVYALDGNGTNASGSTSNAPGSVLKSHTLSVANLDTTGKFTSIMFDAPLEINQKFAVGLDISGIDDTLGIVTTTDGDATTDLAWEQFSNGDWYTFQANDSWGLAVDMGFFPVIGAVETYDVTFTVTDGNEAIADATIQINNTELTTDANGQATATLINDSYYYSVSADGFENASGIVEVSGMDMEVEVTMNPLSGDSREVTFTVNNGNNPVEGATISIDDNTLTTNSDGIATISLKDGEYTFTVSATGFVDYTSIITVDGEAVEKEITLSPVTSIQAAEATGIRVYPNPAFNRVTVEAPQAAAFKLLNLQGQLIIHQQMQSATTRLDVSTLNPGLYMLRIHLQNHKIYTTKLMVR